MSAQNATRHGLSVPLPTHLVEPVQHQLVQLIMSDGFDHEIAHDLADKIIEYERNIMYLIDITKIETISPYDPIVRKRATIHQLKERQERLATTLEDIIQQELEVENREGINVEDQEKYRTLSQVKQVGKGLNRAEMMLELKRKVTSQRYFKRASNQLIKALRRL